MVAADEPWLVRTGPRKRRPVAMCGLAAGRLSAAREPWDFSAIPYNPQAPPAVFRTPQAHPHHHLLDLLLISVPPVWFDRPETVAPAWYRAHTHPVAARRCACSTRTWRTTGRWRWAAAEVGVSRTTLAESFRNAVGVPAMTYLTEWRLALAADLLAPIRRHTEHRHPAGRR
ncbi:hypothetical protein GCM10009730_51180 [Streptomyces albidochromogenes]|uniref:hypothetical protein n=1 Tax=Streptomyces albidochromogenes TaxID=329524 RepID=UPI00110FB17A|nr:hypothetical protein [Streptomyces albidochromogenes]